MPRGIFDAANPAIDRDVELRPRALEAIDAIVIERRDIAVLARREPVEPGLARMHDQRVDAGGNNDARQRIERLLGILLIDADAALHRDRHAHRRLHRGNAIADELRLRHQAGTEASLLHAIRRTADIEIDLVIAEVGADARTLGERARVRAAELHGDRMLGRVERKQARAVAAQHRAGRDHLGVEQRAAREQAMEEPAMPVRPFHHRCDREASVQAEPQTRCDGCTRGPCSLRFRSRHPCAPDAISGLDRAGRTRRARSPSAGPSARMSRRWHT